MQQGSFLQTRAVLAPSRTGAGASVLRLTYQPHGKVVICLLARQEGWQAEAPA
jgi:hypothetical protein